MSLNEALDLTHPKGDIEKTGSAAEFADSVVETYAGKMRIRWDESAAVTAMGQMPVFIDFLKTSGLWDGFLEAIAVKKEIGIDISSHRSKSVNEFANQSFDYVITVCDNANESCPISPGHANRIHYSFDDPAALEGNESERLALFRRVRDEIRRYLREFAAQRA